MFYNEKWYGVRVTPDDLTKIPASLEAYTLKHFGKKTIMDVFGTTEQSLYEELIMDHSTSSYVNDSPVFLIDRDFYVYPNITAFARHWRLGNLKKDGVETEFLKNTHHKYKTADTQIAYRRFYILRNALLTPAPRPRAWRPRRGIRLRGRELWRDGAR